jgi:hypothetical protein
VNASVVLSDALHITGPVSLLKIRGGWAQVGKDTDPYRITNTYPFSQPFGSYPLETVSDKYYSANLKPEMTRSTEVGLEAAFFNNRLRTDITYYTSSSFNQILLADVSATTGSLQRQLNGGQIDNHGIEVTLGGTPVSTASGFRWDVNFNYARNVSKVIELDKDGTLQNYVLGSSGNIQVLASKGERYGALYGKAFKRNEAGQIITSASGTPVIADDKKILGYFTPKWTGSVNNAFSFKGISLSFLIDTRQGGKIWSGTNYTGIYTGVLAESLPGRDQEHGGLPYYFVENNTEKATVRLADHSASSPNGETVYHDGVIFNGVAADGKKNEAILPAQRYYKSVYSSALNESSVYDASFIKLREVKLGYALPNELIRKLGVQSVNITIVARNLWYIDKKVPNIDPETAFNTGNGQGLETLQIPTVRSLGVNLRVSF